jgi:reductive dehalogenase
MLFFIYMSTALPFIGILLCLFLLSASITSLFEKEYRAALIFVAGGLIIPFPYLFPAFSYIFYPSWIESGLVLIPAVLLVILFGPFRGNIRYTRQQPVHRFDERDTMFSRRELVPGSEGFDNYYKKHPERKFLDNQFRKKPGLLKAGTKYFDPILFAASNSLFEKVDELHPRVDGEPASQRMELEPALISDTLLRMIGEWGAHSAGITKLKDYHVYSYGGRGDRYGQEFSIDHKYAIALTVEMDYDMMKSAPAAPTVVESARQYLQSGMIAVQIAEFIRGLGYPARAHIDGNYHVICPLVARDAGLGEIGRMGLLMTPGLGPRCRVAVITTDLPLVSSKVKSDATIIDFCRHCQKCALLCPGQSIPYGPGKQIDSTLRWQINSESCYTFWCQAGTDCGRCMIVCPYAHPDNWLHQIIRFGIRNNVLFRRLAVPMDDLFYGKKSRPGSITRI